MKNNILKHNLSNINKKKVSNFKKICLNFDLFGTIYFPTLFHNDKHKTLYGAFLTIILFLIIIIKIIYIIFHIVTKDNYQVRTEKFSDTDIRTILSNFSITVCTDDTFSIEKNVRYNPISSSNASTNESSEPILLNLNNSIQCLLYELDNFTLQDSDYKENIEFLQTSIKVNKNNTTSLFTLKFGFPLIYPSISNYYNPLQNRTKMIYLSDANKKGQTIRIYLDKLQVRYKNNYFMNLLGIDKTFNYTVLNSVELIDNLSIFGTSGYSFIEVYYTGWRTLYTFTAYDLDNDICAFGGFINIFFFIFNSIGKLINTIFLRKKIEKSLSITRAKTISTIYQKTNTNNTLIKNINTISNNNIINFSIKDKELKQNNYIDNKKYLDVTQNVLINTNELESEIIKNFDELDEISKFESEQFNKLIDYGNIYQMFKDIILLELLCLNSDTAKIFFKYRHNGIDLSKLEDNIIDNCFSVKKNNGFDNIIEKINILNNNLYCSSKILPSSIDNKNSNNFI